MSATVWVGGHLILVASYLPRAIKEKNQNYILNYEKKYEPIGMLSLILLILSGILMAYKYGVTIEHWFEFATPIPHRLACPSARLGNRSSGIRKCLNGCHGARCWWHCWQRYCPNGRHWATTHTGSQTQFSSHVPKTDAASVTQIGECLLMHVCYRGLSCPKWHKKAYRPH